MELRLQKEQMEQMTCVVNRTAEDTFNADVVVPDALPDVAAVHLTDGDFCLWRMDLSSGAAEAEGEWKGTVCCSAETDGGVFSFPVSVGVRLRIHNDGIKPELRPYASFRVKDVQTQLMNSRKLRVKVRLSCALRCYASEMIEFTNGLESAPPDVYTRLEPLSFSVVAGVEEQVFTAGGSSGLRASPMNGMLLASHSVTADEQTQISAGRAVLSGTVCTDVLYLTEDRTPVHEMIRTPFSQLLDLEQLHSDDTLQVSLQLTAAELLLHGENTLETEFHIVVQMLQMRSVEVSVLTDAYSVGKKIAAETETSGFALREAENAIHFQAEAEAGEGKTGESVLAVYPRLRLLQQKEDLLEGETQVWILLASADGFLRSVSCVVPFSGDLAPGTEIISVDIDSASAQIVSGSIRAGVSITSKCCRSESVQLCQIMGLEQSETESSCETSASVTLVRREEGQDLWGLAKRYASSVEAIGQANALCAEETKCPYLLVPRIRLQ